MKKTLLGSLELGVGGGGGVRVGVGWGGLWGGWYWVVFYFSTVVTAVGGNPVLAPVRFKFCLLSLFF